MTEAGYRLHFQHAHPLAVDAKRRWRVNDVAGFEFASARSIEAAALIVLIINKAVENDFGGRQDHPNCARLGERDA